MAVPDPKTIKQAFGKNLARIRKEKIRDGKPMSQETLALESDVARSYLGGVERGQRNIALVNIYKLAKALGVPAAELMKFDVPAQPTPKGKAKSK